MTLHPRHLLLLALALGACATDRPADAPDDTRPAAADSLAPAAAQTSGDTVPADAIPAEAAITLAADGLDLTTSSLQRFTFGAGRTRVLAELGGVLGPPTEQGTMGECPSGPLYQVGYAKGLQLSFQDSAFVGWFARQGALFRSARGIGPGSTLGELRAAYPSATVEETSLGYEFAATELYGVVSDTTDAGVVEAIFAGINCIFR